MRTFVEGLCDFPAGYKNLGRLLFSGLLPYHRMPRFSHSNIDSNNPWGYKPLFRQIGS